MTKGLRRPFFGIMASWHLTRIVLTVGAVVFAASGDSGSDATAVSENGAFGKAESFFRSQVPSSTLILSIKLFDLNM